MLVSVCSIHYLTLQNKLYFPATKIPWSQFVIKAVPAFDRSSIKIISNYFTLPHLQLPPICICQSTRLSEKALMTRESSKMWSCFPLVSLLLSSAKPCLKSWFSDTLRFLIFFKVIWLKNPNLSCYCIWEISRWFPYKRFHSQWHVLKF